MDKKKISILLALSMILTGSIGARNSFASERLDIVSEVLETVPVDNGDFYESYDEGSRPDGVVQMVVKTTPVDENGNEAKGTETQEITGKSSMPDPSELGLYAKDIVNMVMPVIPEDTYDFVMDSEDLLSRYSVYKDSYDKASLYFTNTTGEKAHTCISDVAMAKNKSSVPVLLYVTLQVENEYGWSVNYTDMDSVESDTGKNISFALIPVSANSVIPGDDTEDIKVEDQEGADGQEAESALSEDYKIFKDRMISIDETGKAEMILYLPGTPDNFDLINDKYMAKEDAVWSSLGFVVTGACNTKADWSEMDERSNAGETLGIHISYRMDLLSEKQEEMISNGLVPDPETGVIVFGEEGNMDENNEDDSENTGEDAEIGENTHEEEAIDGKEPEITESETGNDKKDKIVNDEELPEEFIDDKEKLTDEL